MTYTKLGPFVDGGAPYLSAETFNALEAGIIATQPTNAANAVTGWYHVDAYGAVGDGTTVDRTAIQNAINAANTAYVATGAMQRVYFPAKTFIVDAVNYIKDDLTVNGVVSLMLYDGVELFGPGTLKVKNGAYGSGALYGIIRSKSGGATNIAVTGLTFDGNTANVTASTQCSNVLLEALANIRVNNTRHITANGVAVLVRGVSGSAPNIEINDNVVLSATSIGLQCSHFDGLVIRGNYVANTADNGIDIYGENGTTTVDGVNFTIVNNVLKNNYVGIFPETVAQGVVADNVISAPVNAGIHINRINGQPHDILIADNTITAAPYGVYVTGDTGGVVIRGNTCTGFTSAGVQLGGGGGNCSQILIDGNTLNPTGTTVPLVALAGNQVAFIRIRGTATTATNRNFDHVNTAATSVSLTYEPTFLLEAVTNNVTVASAGTLSITVPATSAGTLTVHGTSGGAWSSVWHGVWVSDAARVDVTSLVSDFTTPGQLVSSVTGSTTTLVITVTAAASGSSCSFDYSLRRVTP